MAEAEGQCYTCHSITPNIGSTLSGLEQQALLGRWGAGRIIVALWRYFDESGEHDANGKLLRLTLGGFFARWEDVRRLCERWRVALDDEGLGEFHMKEIASDEAAFASWQPERQNRLTRFADILCDSAAEFGAFSYGVPPSLQYRAFRESYESALGRILIVAASLAEKTKEEVHLVFAHTNEIGQGRVGEYFDGLGWSEYLAGYTVARSRKEPALQAAEIVARGLNRYMEDGTTTETFRRVIASNKPFRTWPEGPVSASEMIQAERRERMAQKLLP